MNLIPESSPVLRQAQLSGQEGEDLGAVLLVLVGVVGGADGRHRQQHTGGAGAADQHRLIGLHHHVHSLGGDKIEAQRVRLDGTQSEGRFVDKTQVERESLSRGRLKVKSEQQASANQVFRVHRTHQKHLKLGYL